MNISIIEFAVYAFVAYSSLLMLIIQISKDGAMTKTRTGTLARSIYILPGMICMILLVGSGVDIFIEAPTSINTLVYNGTNGLLITNSTETIDAKKITLQNPMWGLLHFMFFLIMFAYVITNVLKMLSSKD